jgi:hypothetical protein
LSSGTNENLTIDAKGSGTITLNATATGAITLSRATTLSAALTYGGVALSNSVTGTGSMVLSAGPTFTGVPAAPTAAVDTNTTQLATTAYVIGQISSTTQPPAWTGYTPTVTAQTGTFTTVSATGAYRRFGKIIFFRFSVSITTNGTAGTSVQVTLPGLNSWNIAQHAFVGRANAISGKLLIGYFSGTDKIAMQNYDATYPGANGEQLIMSGVYEGV